MPVLDVQIATRHADPCTTAIYHRWRQNGTYFQLYSDELGMCRVYEMSIGNGEWKLWREGEPFSQGFTATLSDDGNTITGRWEIAEDFANYATDFDIVCRRIDT